MKSAFLYVLEGGTRWDRWKASWAYTRHHLGFWRGLSVVFERFLVITWFAALIVVALVLWAIVIAVVMIAIPWAVTTVRWLFS